MREKDFGKIETKNNICIKVFCYENGVLLVIDDDKSHYVYIKDFNRFMFHKTKKKKKKNIFVRVVYSVLVAKMC